MTAPMTLLFKFTALLCAAAILVLSLLPVSGPGTFQHADKVQHLIAYAGLAGLVGLGWPQWRLPAIVGLTALFGLGVEIAQGLAGTGRMASAADALANLLGAVLAGLGLVVIRRHLVRREKS